MRGDDAGDGSGVVDLCGEDDLPGVPVGKHPLGDATKAPSPKFG